MQPLTDALAGAPRQLVWNDKMTSSFQQTKECLARATLLFHQLTDAELRVNTDASTRAIAGAIHQVVGGRLQPLGFFSRRTSPAESRYSAYDLELLAIYSTLIKFRHILEGRRFRIWTDQKPLKRAFLKTRDPVSNRRRHQLAFISEFATDIAHVPGLENIVADALTRQFDDEKDTAFVHSITHALVDVDLGDLAREQPPIEDEQPSALKLQLISFPGVSREIVCDISLGRPRVLVPESRRHSIFDAVHGLAHPSGRATLSIVARSYVWRNMRQDVLLWARQCKACAASKVARHTTPPVKAIPVPLERFSHVHVDIVGPFVQDQGCKYILTMIDRTTRWPEATPIENTSAETVLQAFLATWIARYGIPCTVTTDRGAQFTSTVWKSVLARLGINIAATTAYHPQANGVVERFHRTLKDALRCSVRASKSWMRSLPWVMLGIRNSPKLDTSTSTAEVLFGVPLRIPGACFGSNHSPSISEQLQLLRANAAAFTPEVLDHGRFKISPFVAKSLRVAKFVYIRDDRLGKASLTTRYLRPFKVINKDWQNNTFRVDMGSREDSISLARLKAASVSEEST